MCAPDIPDTSAEHRAAIESNERIANRQLELQEQALDYFRGRQENVDRVAEEVTRRQLGLAEETAAQGRDLYNYQKEVFRPVEQSLVAEAMRESTPEYYERFASEAVARQAMADANARTQMQQVLSSMGVNPNSGAYAAGLRQTQLASAAGLGAVANEARDRAEALGWARRAEVAGLGKGLVGAGNASYGLATGANTAAGNSTNQATQTAASTMGTPAQYGQLGLTAAGNAVNAYGDIYRAQVGAAGAGGGGVLSGALGNALGYWASTKFAI